MPRSSDNHLSGGVTPYDFRFEPRLNFAPESSYDVELTSSAEKELKKLSGQLIARIVPRLEFSGGDDEWRIRVGDYRAVYTIDDAKLLVEVTRIRHRSEVYER
jgi:mRNA interferase RelE/StbE